MTLVDGGIRTEAVEVSLAVDRVYPRAGSPLDHDIERMIIVSTPVVLNFEQFSGSVGYLCFNLGLFHGASP